eukprot:CAMPEP_0171916416 /NCGR_PEP_ID=MMETSP0993-20121228/14844_1 /TAXON_ID=483369 /ORGANISM="non described non described, Strain CCMP2098" /LENGTH=36 /DNA_ID= /DNA_START= /DNA_END= /DNA_ORIENTATION=
MEMGIFFSPPAADKEGKNNKNNNGNGLFFLLSPGAA